MSENAPLYLTRPGRASLAYVKAEGSGPGVVFLGGFRSDMTGGKALALDAFCRARGQAFLRFDYTGHGASEGRFEEGTIGAWAQDALDALDALTEGPQILVGSSMGGWLALLAAQARPERVAGFVGIAPAPDFTEELMWARFAAHEREAILRDGAIAVASEYGPPYAVTRALIEDGRRRLLLTTEVKGDWPARILQGMEDPDVPWERALRLVAALEGRDVRLTLIKDGDHRLSRPQDLELLQETVAEISRAAAARSRAPE